MRWQAVTIAIVFLMLVVPTACQRADPPPPATGPPPPADQAGPKENPGWPEAPPPAGFPLPILGDGSPEANFESREAGFRVWLPARARDWSVQRGAKAFGAVLPGNRVFSIASFEVPTYEEFAEFLTRAGIERSAQETAVEERFLLWDRYPAVAHEFRDESGCRLVLTLARDEQVYQMRAWIPNLGERPEEAVRFFESLRLVDPDTSSGTSKSKPVTLSQLKQRKSESGPAAAKVREILARRRA